MTQQVQWHTKTILEILKTLRSREHGLTKEETERRFKEYGPNKLPEAKVDSLMEELIKDGESGFVIESDIEKLVEAIGKVDQIDRSKVRKHVEDNFSKERMVDEYEKLYYELCQKRA